MATSSSAAGTKADSTSILDAYANVHTRQVDLVGDYAGTELFIVHGDSLLLHCFTTGGVDFAVGLQLLHAIYNVESFLQQLVLRKCNYHIVFFDDHRHLCVPAHVSGSQNEAKYLFAREVALKHLQANVMPQHPTIEIHSYPTISDPAWQQYLRASGAYFVMCHDGAISVDKALGSDTESESSEEDSSSSESETDEKDADGSAHGDKSGSGSHGVAKTGEAAIATTKRLHARRLILNFLQQGYNVALINGLAFRDSKVMTMVLEGSKHMRNQDEDFTLASLSISSEKEEDLGLDDAVRESINDLRSEAYQLTVLVIRKLFQEDSITEQLAVSLMIHVAMVHHMLLSGRGMEAPTIEARMGDLMALFANTASPILRNKLWSDDFQHVSERCDLADCFDGFLLQAVVSRVENSFPISLPTRIQDDVKDMINTLGATNGPNLSSERFEHSSESDVPEPSQPSGPLSKTVDLLPFSNPVLDPHLKSIVASEDNKDSLALSAQANKVFKELSHWHNSKKALPQKKAPAAVTLKARQRALKLNQIFRKEMIAYSGSLTGAVGKVLEPETIIVEASSKAQKASKTSGAPKENKALPSSSTGPQKGRKPGKGQQAGSKKEEMKAANTANKAEDKNKKHFTAWNTFLDSLKPVTTDQLRYIKVTNYIQSWDSEKRRVLAAEAEVYQLSLLIQIWTQLCKNKQQQGGIASLIWNHINNLRNVGSVPPSIKMSIEKACKMLNIQTPSFETASTDQPLSFPFTLPEEKDVDIKLGSDPRVFQLTECGPYMDRSMDSSKDDRVSFNPDAWQRRVLDLIDTNKSIFVVAPTSAGKTFISFYAMKKVLRQDDNGVLVYVAPTKALVNQIAAEIQARFRKSYAYDAKSVWAIHTRDYRVNSPTGCQILVTVPHILQILLLSPGNANAWSGRVKRIIFDEIHSIGQAEDGIIWEQLLLLSPCPIIALSATVGNPTEFSEWLENTQKAVGCDLSKVQHPHRYSDLRKYVYSMPPTPEFKGLSEPEFKPGMLGLDSDSSFVFVHPVASLVNRSRGIPDDLHLEPKDCWTLWDSMRKHATANYPVDASLHPDKCLPETVTKMDTIAWEARLKDLLKQWMSAEDSPFDAVAEDFFLPRSLDTSSHASPDDLLNSATHLLARLHANNALPAVVFNYDRSMCEQVAHSVLDTLKSAEEAHKGNSAAWAKRLDTFEQYKKAQASKAAKKPTAAKSKKSSKPQEGDDPMSKLDMQKDEGESSEANWLANFDPNAPLDDYCFSNRKVMQSSELERFFWRLRRKGTAEWLLEALTRGIGVHHAGMNRLYRQTVEILFRKSFLRVVIATGTLALGINMPAKTTVFTGDSVFLTALNYRQAAGRAGRRGFDLLGNVVFHGVPITKVTRLISSRLPDLNGHFPITTSLVLRLFILLHESNDSPYAKTAINTLLSQPRLYLGGQSFKDQVMHHLRFSIEYLRRQDLLSASGIPLNFAGCIAHLYYTEQSSFAFHTLLRGGVFHKLTRNLNEKNEERVAHDLMLVMAHLFGRRPLRQADTEPENYEKRIKNSPSVVFLPPMPADAEKVLRQHNKETLDIFFAYAKTFAEQHLQGTEDNVLPLTGMKCGGDASTSSAATVSAATILGTPAKEKRKPEPVKVRSAFTALSGHTDQTFTSIHELCSTARSGIFLEESVIPYITVYPSRPSEGGHNTQVPLNAYLYDFYKHGDTTTLEKANGIRKGDVWFVLNDFSLVLATITTSLRNFLRLSSSTDDSMIDIQSSADIAEESQAFDALNAADAEGEGEGEGDHSSAKTPEAGGPAAGNTGTATAGIKKKKAAVAENWEDESESEPPEAAATKKTASARKNNGPNGSVDVSTPASPTSPTSTSAPPSEAHSAGLNDQQTKGEGLLNVLRAFEMLQARFDEKFRAMWA
ncbi:MAG: hypothetical protein M1831_004135 [Alyxoria varia]|nr:MAG: hypothetical protein M1831_004135 [Alyxoria varia]